jgi:hypothetical protein
VGSAGIRVPPPVCGSREGSSLLWLRRLPLSLGSGKKKQQLQQDRDGDAYTSADRVAAAEARGHVL